MALSTAWRRVYAMPVAKLYPSYVAKAEKKGRTRAEVDEIVRWLTGHTAASLQAALDKGVTIEAFFTDAPDKNPARMSVTGSICGVRVETIEEPVMREVRILDKLIDELAKGRPMARILRSA